MSCFTLPVFPYDIRYVQIVYVDLFSPSFPFFKKQVLWIQLSMQMVDADDS